MNKREPLARRALFFCSFATLSAVRCASGGHRHVVPDGMYLTLIHTSENFPGHSFQRVPWGHSSCATSIAGSLGESLHIRPPSIQVFVKNSGSSFVRFYNFSVFVALFFGDCSRRYFRLGYCCDHVTPAESLGGVS